MIVARIIHSTWPSRVDWVGVNQRVTYEGRVVDVVYTFMGTGCLSFTNFVNIAFSQPQLVN